MQSRLLSDTTPPVSLSRERMGLLLGFIGMAIFGGTLPATRIAVSVIDSEARVTVHPTATLTVGRDLYLQSETIDRNSTLRDWLNIALGQPIDLFPWLLIAVLMLLVLEGLVANRFYRRVRP